MTEPDAEPLSTRGRRRWPVLAKGALLIIVVAWVAREVDARLGQVSLDGIPIDYRWMSLGALLSLLASALMAPVTFLAQRAVGVNAGFQAALVAAWGSAVAKYVPGKVASLIGAIALYNSFGVPMSKVVLISVVSALATFSALAVVLIPAVSGLYPAFFEPGSWFAWVLWAVWGGCCLVGLPAIGLRLLRVAWGLGARVWRGEVLVSVSLGAYLQLVLLTALQMVVASLAFWSIVASMASVTVADAYGFGAILLLSGLAGLFAFFAPAGVGVREGLMLTMLAGWGHQAEIALAVVLLRVFQLAADGVLTVAGMMRWRARQTI